MRSRQAIPWGSCISPERVRFEKAQPLFTAAAPSVESEGPVESPGCPVGSGYLEPPGKGRAGQAQGHHRAGEPQPERG